MFMAHSGVRYLVLLFGVFSLAYALFGWVSGRSYGWPMRRFGSAFAGVLHLQLLLGVGAIFQRGFYPALMGHILTMVLAAVVAQLPVSVMRRRPPEQRTYAPHVVCTLIALVLVWAGTRAIGRSLLGSAG